MKRLLLLLLLPIIFNSCGGLLYSFEISRYDDEHISVAIRELGPNYVVKDDPHVGRVYSWRTEDFSPAMEDTNGTFHGAEMDIWFIHLYTTSSDIVKHGIRSKR